MKMDVREQVREKIYMIASTLIGIELKSRYPLPNIKVDGGNGCIKIYDSNKLILHIKNCSDVTELYNVIFNAIKLYCNDSISVNTYCETHAGRILGNIVLLISLTDMQLLSYNSNIIVDGAIIRSGDVTIYLSYEGIKLVDGVKVIKFNVDTSYDDLAQLQRRAKGILGVYMNIFHR